MIHLEDILEAADGQLFGDANAQTFADFCYDSRRVEAGQLFVAIRTEYGDGHQHMAAAVAGGATGIMCQHPPTFDTSALTVIVIRDVERALLRWAQRVLAKYGTAVIGVTGSAGKTTTKELLAALFSSKYNVHRSPASFNGKLGVPLALGKITPQHQIAILEFATDHSGEMAEVLAYVQPLVGIITNISPAYTERLTDLAAITREYSDFIRAVPANGLVILNDDDDEVRALAQYTTATRLTVSVDRGGSSYGADLIAYNLIVARDKTGFDLRYEQERHLAKWTPLLGQHQLYSVLAALAAAMAYEIPLAQSLQILTNIKPLAGRMSPLAAHNNALLIDDTFNAVPESAFAALQWLESVRGKTGRHIVVIGGIDHLGGYALEAHQEIGRRAAAICDLLVTEGELGALVAQAAIAHGLPRQQVKITYTPEDAARVASAELAPTDVILVKGGAAARMEQVSKQLLANPEDSARLVRQDPAYNQVWAERPTRPTWLEVDKAAIAHNTRRLQQLVGPDVALMAVVKANAYGHGAVQAGATALLNGATYLGVASVSEGVDLRQAAIDAPILVLGYTPAWAARDALRHQLALTLYNLELAEAYDRIAREMGGVLNVHIKIDTGMTRLGLQPDQVMPFFRGVKKFQNLVFEGLYTHFAAAESDPDFTEQQLAQFDLLINPLKAAGFNFRYIHAANSAATLTLPKTHFNMVRVGGAIYGLSAASSSPLPADFRSALVWKTSIAQVKQVGAGTMVGYGMAYRARSTERIAVIPVGYADGFRRAPKNWGSVLVRGQLAPLVGRVSMDMAMINVTDIADVAIGDEVVLIGAQGKASISADDVAEALETSAYEVVSTILARVPRV
jgi:Alr-MurF fusion protein